MKRYLLLLLSSLIVISCSNNGPEQLTGDKLAAEKNKVLDAIKDYNSAYQNESFTEIIKTLSEDVVFFGTDSSEVIRSLSEFKTMIQEQWNHYDIKYGNIVDPSVIMDDYGTIASVVFGIPGIVKKDNGPEQHIFFRIARTLVKQDKKWVIASGVIGITQTMPEKVQPAVETADKAAATNAKDNKTAPQLK